MKVTLIGMGCGPDNITERAAAALREASLCIGAKRALSLLTDFKGESIAEYRSQSILELLETRKVSQACVLLTGDSGFYSGAAGLLPLLESHGICAEVIPGISSLQYFAAKLGKAWQEWNIFSAHGMSCDPVYAVMQRKPAFFITSGAETPPAFARKLLEAGLGSIKITIGENLGMDSEKIIRTTAEECSSMACAGLNVMLIEAAPVYHSRTPGIPDDEFLRGKVPMTKQEVRAAILSKLAVSPEDVCWDIGAGTGSVSIELALFSREVWAVEKEPDALELIRKNREKFCTWNLKVASGTAPDALAHLPAPDVVFVGGSSGNLEEILRTVHEVNPKARICISAIVLETLGKAMKVLSELGYEPEVTQIAVSRTKRVASLHLLMAQNPVFLIYTRNCSVREPGTETKSLS